MHLQQRLGVEEALTADKRSQHSVARGSLLEVGISGRERDGRVVNREGGSSESVAQRWGRT